MKTTLMLLSLAWAVALPNQRLMAGEHDKECKAVHGTVSARTDNAVTIDGKVYTLNQTTRITGEDGVPAAITGVAVGDKVCLETPTAESRQVTKLVVMDPADSDRQYAREKLSGLDRATHEKMCKGNHGKVTAKGNEWVTIDGKRYAFEIDTRMIKGGKPVLMQGLRVGDVVCFDTQDASDGTRQITKLMVVDDYERARVRGKIDEENDRELDKEIKKEIKDGGTVEPPREVK